ncbi:MAG: pseudouridine synthase [Verrucomicrobiota bacterium]
MNVRLQKYLADAGVASRRASEALITAGRVQVNGTTVRELGTKVDPASDRVVVDGSPVRPRRRLHLAINKPRGFICSKSDEASRDIVTDLLPAEWRDVYPVGRLDRESEGLLFLTNDGDFCLRMTHPRYGVAKHYLATVVGKVESHVAHRLTHGVLSEGETLRARRVRILAANGSRSLVELELTEGRNREVRRMFEALGFTVERLVRTQIGPIKLGELRTGKWRVLSEPELRSLQQTPAAPQPPVTRPRARVGRRGTLLRRPARRPAPRRPR